jgi:hypothetical protein
MVVIILISHSKFTMSLASIRPQQLATLALLCRMGFVRFGYGWKDLSLHCKTKSKLLCKAPKYHIKYE